MKREKYDKGGHPLVPLSFIFYLPLVRGCFGMRCNVTLTADGVPGGCCSSDC
jgi:hypothetical protein